MGLSVSLMVSGCGSSSSNDPSPIITSESYNGAGSRWDLDFKGDGTATIKEENSNLELVATYQDLKSGFRKITVTSSSDVAKVKVGASTYGFDLPNYMFPFVAFNENKLIPTVTQGSCPAGNIRHNYITSFAKSNTNNNGSIADFNDWGTFGYWSTTASSTHVEVFKRDGTRPSDGGVHDINTNVTSGCQNGKLYDPSGDPNDPYRAETTAYFTKAGGLIWQQIGLGNTVGNSKNDRIENDFMIPYEPNLNTINQIDGNYIGYVVIGNGQSSVGYQNKPVSVAINNGIMTLKNIDTESGVIGSKISEIALTTEVSGTKGLWRGQLTNVSPSGTEGIGCAIDLDAGGSGKNVIICGGMLPDGTTNQLYSAILVSK